MKWHNIVGSPWMPNSLLILHQNFITSLRISEFAGLTKLDIDFKDMTINADHQPQRFNGVGYKIVVK